MNPEVALRLPAPRALRSSAERSTCTDGFRRALREVVRESPCARIERLLGRFVRTRTRSGGSLKGSSEPGNVPNGS
jgi:hypothetical protein